jgi:hypothetical protein
LHVFFFKTAQHTERTGRGMTNQSQNQGSIGQIVGILKTMPALLRVYIFPTLPHSYHPHPLGRHVAAAE